nr:M20/M25/M40 family metallo-hydrolase [Streptomyces sp. SKN60]
MRRTPADVGAVVELAQELVRRPSRGGVDPYGPVLGVLERRLGERGLPHRRLRSPAGEVVGVLVEVRGGRPGPWWVLDACVDTAPFGDTGRWSFSPTSGEVRDGWLLGRGAADSKLAAALFCHLAADLAPRGGGVRRRAGRSARRGRAHGRLRGRPRVPRRSADPEAGRGDDRLSGA